jgi:hypothetical protein
MHTARHLPLCIAALGVCSSLPIAAQHPAAKAIIVVVGDPERMNIGQDGYCGRRTEINQPKDKQFRIPAGVETFLFTRTTFRLSYGTYVCEGDFSFVPEGGQLHIIRYIMEDRQCKLEMYRGLPGETPLPMPFQDEQRRSCLAQ